MLLEKITTLCKEQKITFAELERKVGLGNGTISRWGKMNPRVDTLKAVADYFGVTLDELVRKEE
ncbi:MAG: helix-turn-helix transcriptional regulator [Clostridia bacterium]|nr:helix-turn-helix transcriptional regulator [Clostridia bacterium]